VKGHRLSRLAAADLAEIFRYTLQTWGEEQLELYLRLLEKTRDELVENPFIAGSMSREDLAPGCRIMRVGKHYFVYRIKDDDLQIARTLHESMDFVRHLPPSFRS
jgi:toxin ParE1/3/4